MSDVNKVFVMGRLVRNAETKTTSNGTFIANFSIATNRSKKNADETWTEVAHFFNFSLYNNRAKGLEPYLKQGQQVFIEGHLSQRRWEKDGKKQQRMEIEVDNLRLIGRPTEKKEQEEQSLSDYSGESNELPLEEEFSEPSFDPEIF
jgi:single-stranded DNA-binding protein